MKNKIFITLFIIAFLGVISSLLKNLSLSFGVPNIIPFLRSLLIYLVFLLCVNKFDFIRNNKFMLVSFLFLTSLTAYFFIGIYNSQILPTLYYLRVYIDPILYGLALIVFVSNYHYVNIKFNVFFLYCVGFSLFSILIYVLLMVNPEFVKFFIGDEISTAWYISGGTFMRMGSPTSSPNTLGIITAMQITVLYLIYMYRSDYNRLFFVIAVLFSSICLLLTFSRSSWFMVILNMFFITIFNIKTNFEKVKFIVFYVCAILVIGFVILAIIDMLNDGFISVWLELSFSGKDPSMIGHADSFVSAFKNIDQYFLVGYPHGTVGAKAMLFSSEINNVENTFLIIFYDMGLLNGTIFLLSYILLVCFLCIDSRQMFLIPGFIFCLQLLPYIFEYDVVIYFLFFIVFIRYILRASDKNEKNADISTVSLR